MPASIIPTSWIVASAVFAAGVGMPGIALGQQPPCGPHEAIVKLLADQYDEQRIGIGLEKRGSVVEVWVSEAGTWTLLMTTATGTACLIGSGEAWQIVPLQVPLPGEES